MRGWIWGAVILAAYLVGSIPFGYLITYWLKGIDIRTVGSRNLGATNVGRVLGFRYFLLVLALDALKGFGPVLGFPWLLRLATGSSPADLPVLLALAAIIGHNFPIYLRFRGGKGVATSLGAVVALDPVSSAAAVAVFGAVLLLTRYVSLSSLAGGIAFLATYFIRVSAPWSLEHMAMSLFAIVVVALLIVRHRSNLARVWAGTENRVSLTRSRPSSGSGPQPSGRMTVVLLIALSAVSFSMLGTIWLVHHARQPVEATAGPWVLREIDRVNTGQQRVDRVVFTADGGRLAGICPRYNRLLIYDVESRKRLKAVAEIPLEGRPVSIAVIGTGFVVLERPAGDQKHLEPGWWEVFDRDGKRTSAHNLAGYYPDDLAVSPDGRCLFVLSSGRAEGDERKPLPALDVIAIDLGGASPRLLGRVAFDPSDDPQRLTLSAQGRFAAVFLAKSKRSAAVDLGNREAPCQIGTTRPVTALKPYLSASPDSEWIMMPVPSEGESVAVAGPGGAVTNRYGGETTPVSGADFVISTHPNESYIEIAQSTPRVIVGRFPLQGPLNLGRTRPTGLAYAPGAGLLAVATRSGAIHLVEMRSLIGDERNSPARVATVPDGQVRR
jgi:glycerol-3-phosphate acyltransferase PlsY